jgi:hypothetical protein
MYQFVKVVKLGLVWMTWIVQSKDKEFAYGTTLEVYKKNPKCYKCTQKTMKVIQIFEQKFIPMHPILEAFP